MQTPFSVCFLFVFVKVLNSNPLPGMKITPSQGVVPVGGLADLNISFTPSAHMSFDKKVEVFKTGRTLSFECYPVCLCVYIHVSFGFYFQCSNAF